MDKITRRDFINGTLMVAGASIFPFACRDESILNKLDRWWVSEFGWWSESEKEGEK